MKRILAITVTLVMLLAALTGCVASQNSENSQSKLLKEENVKSISITSQPNGYEYSLSGDGAKAVVDYISNLQLISDFEENPDEYTGMTWVISLEYDNGTSSTIYHFGNMFVRADNGPWYKMDYDEASGFRPLLEGLSSATIGESGSQENENLVSHIRIKSGVDTIYPFGYLVWSQTDNGDGTIAEMNADRLDMPDVINRYADVIPTLVLEERVSYSVQVNGRVEDVFLYTPSGDGYTETETTFDALSSLADGTYYVAFHVLLSGNCDPDAPQNSYRYEDVFCLVVESEEDLPHSGYEVEINLYQYTWDGWGISTKTVGACDVAYNIIDALKSMKETGKTVPKISDDVLELGGGQYPVERGTMWIESSGKIYRLTPDLSQICLVETHFGEGKILEITDEFRTNVNNAWHYAPYDYYKGTYNRGDSTVNLKSVFKSGSSIQLRVKDIHVESNYDPSNTITVELLSTVDQEVNLKLRCQQSYDNLAVGDDKTVQLKKGVPATVELTFGGWPNCTYWVYIEAGFTKVEITINP